MTGRVSVLGSFMMDLIAYTSRRPLPGETIRGDSFVTALGGKGFNQAVAAARAGAATQMLGQLGTDDFGDRFMEALEQEGISSLGVERDVEQGTGVGLPVVETGGENSIIIVPRANDCIDESFVLRHANQIQTSQVLLLQLELSIEAAVAAARVAKDAGVLVVLNPAPAAPIEGFIGLVDLIVPNEIEFAALTGQDGSMSRRASKLRDQLGGSGVVITHGSKGAYVLVENELVEIHAPSVVAIDTVGAGDTLCGYLAARLALGDTLLDATTAAVAAASISVTRSGAAMSAPRADEVRTLVAQMQKIGDRS